MDMTLGAPFQPPYLAGLWEGCPVSGSTPPNLPHARLPETCCGSWSGCLQPPSLDSSGL